MNEKSERCEGRWRLRPRTKVALVGLGYIGALAIAFAAVSLYIAVTNGPDRQTYAAMFAFGDSLLFLAVFGVAALVPTGAGFFFLRPYRPFWRVLSVGAVVIATTGVAAFFRFLAARGIGPHAAGNVWTTFAVLRVLIAPLFALTFVVSALFAPSRRPRIALLVATAVEAFVSLGYGLIWFHPFR
jgi:hypothetical protein